jgi:hypothetical protein
MKFVTCLIVTAFLLGLCVTAMAWFEDFNDYYSNEWWRTPPYTNRYMPSPEDNAMVATAGKGIDGTPAGSASHAGLQCSARRDVESGTVLFQQSIFAALPAEWAYGDPHLYTHINNSAGGGLVAFITGDTLANKLILSMRSYMGTNTYENLELLPNTWYDIKMQWDTAAGTMTPSYKLHTDTTWNVRPTQVCTGFTAAYVLQRAWSSIYVDNMSATGPPPGSIGGTVTLENYPAGDLRLAPIEVQVRVAGQSTALITKVVTLALDGSYLIPNVPAGTYDVAFKGTSWLRKVSAGVQVSSDLTTDCDITLANGDCDGDNEVTTSDLSVGLKNINVTGNP